MTKDEIMAAVAGGLQGVADVVVRTIPEHKTPTMAWDLDTDQYCLLIPENSKQDVIERAIMAVKGREGLINV